jgi:hypothetical protein
LPLSSPPHHQKTHVAAQPSRHSHLRRGAEMWTAEAPASACADLGTAPSIVANIRVLSHNYSTSSPETFSAPRSVLAIGPYPISFICFTSLILCRAARLHHPKPSALLPDPPRPLDFSPPTSSNAEVGPCFSSRGRASGSQVGPPRAPAIVRVGSAPHNRPRVNIFAHFALPSRRRVASSDRL